MTDVTIIPGANFNTQLENGVLNSIGQEISKRVVLLSGKLKNDISSILVLEFNNTEVIKSLRGNGGTDLQAHFGLTSTQANNLADGMSNIIKNSIQIKTNPNNLDMVVSVKAVETDWVKYTQLPEAEYVSEPSNAIIPVVRWMLIDPNIDIGQAAYEIVFSGNRAGSYNSRIDKVSRSGRAIMISLESLGGGTPYVLPDIIRANIGENFIEFALGQKGVLDKVSNILINSLK